LALSSIIIVTRAGKTLATPLPELFDSLMNYPLDLERCVKKLKKVKKITEEF
jgi:hypothetical protein